MSRWPWFFVCAILGLALLACGFLVPAHLRAIDSRVLEAAGQNTPGLVARGQALADAQKLGAAQLLLAAAQEQGVAGRDRLGATVTNLAQQHPDWRVWGGPEPRLEGLLGFGGQSADSPRPDIQPFVDFIVRREAREKALESLQSSPRPSVQELLRCRQLTNMAIFAPSDSASGQAFDAALSTAGLLLDDERLADKLRDGLSALATGANRGGNSAPLEQALMDLLSLGERMNWGQLAAFVGRIEDTETLRMLAHLVREHEGQLPAIFSAVELTGEPSAVAKYLMKFDQSGAGDLALSLRFGAGAVNELLQRNQPVHQPGFGERIGRQGPLAAFAFLAVNCSLRSPWIALMFKWFLYLWSGFLLAAAMHFARPAPPALEEPLQVRGFHVAREVLFALGFLLVVLMLSEPFLAQQSQKVEFPFRLRLPGVGAAVPAGTPSAQATLMNQLNQTSPGVWLTMLLFFVLQALIYTACLVKLAEIKRQRVLPRVKLRLLENEEHLFDAGLYLGFAGTIVSLILVSLHIFQLSLMAAYSSTSFGIIFVSVFKIFHLRPARRTMLLQAEATPVETVGSPAVPAFAPTS